MKEVRSAFDAAAGEYQRSLPKHVPTERFIRHLVTAVQLNPELLQADRQSLMAACQKAAQDGLLPDGREGALVIFRSRNKQTGMWVKAVQWMPMLLGLMKKARNSGEISSLAAHIVYDNDEFHLALGDQEEIYHRPYIDGDRGKPRLVYAICRLKDGTLVRDWMTMDEVAKVRSASRAAESGPWVDWFDEMCKKTVLRRLIKRLPASTDKEGTETFMKTIEQDDEHYDLPRITRDATPRVPPPSNLDEFADPETGEVLPPAPPPAEEAGEEPPAAA
jgi:recombination protein RecT